jgi:hypothetical protein
MQEIDGTGGQLQQSVPEWPPITCKLYPSGRQSHANSRNFIHVACDWWPLGYNLHATVGHLGTLCMQLLATRVHFICAGHQSHSNFACATGQLLAKQARCQNNYLNKKMKKPLKNFRIYATYVLARVYPSTPCMARSNLMRQFH